jgi:hypothetical protein
MNGMVSPAVTDAVDGEITISTRLGELPVAEVTVIEPCPATPDSVAVMLAKPVA